MIGIVLIIALVIGGVVWYSASQKAKKEMLYTEGVAALDTGRYADAVQIFTELREREYKDSVILLKQAKEHPLKTYHPVICPDWRLMHFTFSMRWPNRLGKNLPTAIELWRIQILQPF